MHGFLGPNGAGQVDDDPRPARPAARRRGRRRACSAATRGATRVALHRRLAYVPGDVNLWPNLSGGEVIDLLGRLRGGLDPRRRAELLERFDLDPTKKAPHLLQGQPPEGRARRRAGLRRRAADPRRADLGPRPADGGGVPGVHRARSAPRGRTVLLSSHILAEVEALCDRVSIIRAGRTVESGTLADLRHLTRTSIVAETDEPVPTAWRPGRRARPARRRPPGALRRRHRRSSTRRCGTSPRPACAASPAARRRSRSCSCATTATSSTPAERADRRSRAAHAWSACAATGVVLAVLRRARRRLRADHGRRASRTSTPRRRPARFAATIEGNGDLHGDLRAGAGARHDRRPHRVAHPAARSARDHRADEHAPGRPPHARRGGARAHRAGARRRGRPRARRSPPRWPSSSGMDVAIGA